MASTLKEVIDRAAEKGLNLNGLTFVKWLAAAGVSSGDGKLSGGGVRMAPLYAAWKRGEDPSEHRRDKKKGFK